MLVAGEDFGAIVGICWVFRFTLKTFKIALDLTVKGALLSYFPTGSVCLSFNCSVDKAKYGGVSGDCLPGGGKNLFFLRADFFFNTRVVFGDFVSCFGIDHYFGDFSGLAKVALFYGLVVELSDPDGVLELGKTSTVKVSAEEKADGLRILPFADKGGNSSFGERGLGIKITCFGDGESNDLLGRVFFFMKKDCFFVGSEGEDCSRCCEGFWIKGLGVKINGGRRNICGKKN